jgi:hypothetical protein
MDVAGEGLHVYADEQMGTYRFTTITAIAGSYNGLEIHLDATLERVKLDKVN